jgi:proteic killer suppression protein
VDFEFYDSDLEDVYYEPSASLGHGDSVDKGFRKVVGFIKSAKDERDLYAMKSLHYEKLKGKRSHQRSLKINDQWRLIVERVKQDDRIRLILLMVEDYH